MKTIDEKYQLAGNNFEENPIPALAVKIRSLNTTLDPNLTRIKIPPVNELLHNVLHFSDHLADAANKVLDGEDPSESMAKYMTMTHIQALADEVRNQDKLRQIDAINSAAANIFKTIRAEVFEPAIEALRELIEEHEGGWNIETAISAKDYKSAAIIEGATRLVARLNAADEARRLLHPGAFTGPAAYGLTPEVDLSNQGTLSWWMQTLNDGHEPVFSTLAEWYRLHHSEAHSEYRASAAAAAEADQPEVISLGWNIKN
ncbi:hypothetical protein CVS30_03800 [Arthrobacter psychrolactophilus]|uniref:Uncharacterized protein n=1 Tax=Arthrobacter psychrolactophilus TaxID=92442 RepID=A0A2V5IZ99_9MICC|nr:hypothetical protein [Arthrobacter psychrolactophilus]PYI39793.1 hypothetical protein CVS30_03800 [Arthrobacter psychrolactophilus]